MIHICEYGCGQEAKYQFKNDNWCCSKSHQSCPAQRKKIGINSRNSFEKIIGIMENTKYKLLTTKEDFENIFPKKLLFKCPEGHEFPMRWDCFLSGQRCPECAKKRVSEKNSQRMKDGGADILGEKLRTPFEEIIKFVENEGWEILSKEEDYKNQFSYLWFKCPKGHTFKKRWDGFLAGYRCRECDNEKRRQEMLKGKAAYMLSKVKNPSGPQVELFNLVKEDHPESIMNYQVLNYSIDVVIPNLKIAIEYDGSYWHQDQEKDTKRQKEIEDQGWIFLRYRDYIPSKEELKRDIFFKIQNLRSYS